MRDVGGLGVGEIHRRHPARRTNRKRIVQKPPQAVESPFLGEVCQSHRILRRRLAVLRRVARHAADLVIQRFAALHRRPVGQLRPGLRRRPRKEKMRQGLGGFRAIGLRERSQ